MKDNSGRAIVAFLVVLVLVLAVAWAAWGQSAPVVAAPAVAQAAPGAELHVCATCAYTTVQSAVDAAHSGDVVKVAAGVYTGVHAYDAYTQVVYISKSLVLQGGYTTTNWTTPDPDANHTTLDAERQGRALYVTGDVSVTIEGLRITGGKAFKLGGFGGGVYVSTATVTISHCLVYSNYADAGIGVGGGVYLQYNSATLIGNTMQDNIAGWEGGEGGGLCSHHSQVTLIDNTVQGNTANANIEYWWPYHHEGYGGGLCFEWSTATLSGNVVRDNVASTYGWGSGGGVCFWYSTARLDDNMVQDNIACPSFPYEHVEFRGYGGGLCLIGSDAWLSDNAIVGNVAITTEDGCGYGGGLYLAGGSTATLNNNTVQGNTASMDDLGLGGGLSLENASVTLNGNTIVSNTATSHPGRTGRGGGLYLRSNSFTLTNNLVAGNHATTQGGGLWFGGYSTLSTTGRLLHTTIADNGEQGVYVGDYATLAFTNTIVAGHPGQGIATTGNSTVTLAGTLWHANGVDVSGPGVVVSSTNLTGTPAFVDPGAWDYHLAAGSAAIDAGVWPGPGVTTDIDGDPRPAGTGYDVGADEYRTVGVQLAPDRSAVTAPSTVVTYTHTLTNTGNYTDAFVLAAGSSQGWAQVSPTDPVTLAAGATQAVRVVVTVPTDAISGMVDATTITATLLVDPGTLATATDTTTVGPRRLYLPIALKGYTL